MAEDHASRKAIMIKNYSCSRATFYINYYS